MKEVATGQPVVLAAGRQAFAVQAKSLRRAFDEPLKKVPNGAIPEFPGKEGSVDFSFPNVTLLYNDHS